MSEDVAYRSVTAPSESPGDQLSTTPEVTAPAAWTAGATGAGVVIASLLPATRAEAEAAHQVVETAKEKGQPLLDQARSAGQEVADNVKQSATEAAQQVTQSAQESAQKIKDEGQSSAETVKGEAQA